jgi:prephenate dehydratase
MAGNSVAFQGQPGAYSHLACRHALPRMKPLPTATFEDTFAAVRKGRAKYAMIPIENSVAGRVADIHRLIPDSGLYIIAEHFLRVNHHLLAPRGATLGGIRTVHSHIHALSQCRKFLAKHRIKPIVHADTAGAAADIAAKGDTSEAAIASSLAAEIYGLKSLRANIEDEDHNTTRFLVFAKKPVQPPRTVRTVTSFVFRVRNVPAALYKAMGGFATNGINMTKLESYMVGGDFTATQFYADIEGHPAERNVKLALEELAFFTRELRILGTYAADPFRFGARVDEA